MTACRYGRKGSQNLGRLFIGHEVTLERKIYHQSEVLRLLKGFVSPERRLWVGTGSSPRWHRQGSICTAAYQGVRMDGRVLTFGSGTRLQIHPSKCMTSGSAKDPESLFYSLPWWIVTSWTNSSCVFMRLVCSEIWIPSRWFNSSLFSNGGNCQWELAFSSLQRQALLLFLDHYQKSNCDWLCPKIYFGYQLVSMKGVKLNFPKTLGTHSRKPPCPIERCGRNGEPK